MKIEVFGFRL